MKKHLFNGDRETYTDEAMDIEDEINRALVPIIRKYADHFSIRDIEYVAHSAVAGCCLDELIETTVIKKVK